MIKRTAGILALFFAAAVAHAAMVVNSQVIHPVPVIPHGLDWSIMAVPELHIYIKTLSEQEVRQLLPPVIALGRIEESLTLSQGVRAQSPVHPMLAILAGIVLLLAAYDLIPRAHSQVLRFRSVDLNRDLFT